MNGNIPTVPSWTVIDDLKISTVDPARMKYLMGTLPKAGHVSSVSLPYHSKHFVTVVSSRGLTGSEVHSEDVPVEDKESDTD